MIEEFKKSYKNGYEVMLNPEERDQLVEYIKELEFEKLKNKEVREYIENYNIGMPYDHFVKKENLLEILDKVGDEK